MTVPTTDFRDMWLRSVNDFAGNPAVEVAATGVRVSYADLHTSACTLAEQLRERGVTAGHLVGLRTRERYRFCIGVLGLWLVGAVPVPLSASAPDMYVDQLVRRLGIGAVLVDDDASVNGIGLSVSPQDAAPRRDLGSTTDLAYVMHTSGSTGQPKPVAISHKALASYCTAFAAATHLTRHDRFFQLAPATFDVVFEELLPIWSVGGTAVLAPGTAGDPEQMLTEIEDHDVTVAELTTAYWALLVRHLRASARIVPPRLRLLLMGGELAPVELIEESLQLGLPLAHVYGVTEAGITSTVKHFDTERLGRTASVGTALANSSVYVVDDQGVPVATGATGEVWIGGYGLAEGYLGNPDETARRFVEFDSDSSLPGRYYRTGDVGRITTDGELEILGRLDAQVKVNGVRVAPSEVEAVLISSPLVADAVVIAIRGLDGAHRLRAFVVPDAGADRAFLEQRLHRSLGEQLPHFLVPDRVIAVDALPVTEHGKIDRQALAGIQDDRAEGAALWATPMQQIVAAAWSTALGRPPTDSDQNFGDAGGNSLELLALVVALQEAGLTVTSLDCMTYPTVRSLAGFLEGATPRDAEDDLPHGASALEAHRMQERSQHLQRRRARRGSTP